MAEKKPAVWEPMRDLMELPRWFRRMMTSENMFYPDIDVIEKEDKVILKADLPGIKKEDVNISIEGGSLKIRGERKREKEEQKENYYYCERSFGSFSRSITLPAGIKKEDIKARYKNGTLTVEMPKTEEARKKEVQINVE